MSRSDESERPAIQRQMVFGMANIRDKAFCDRRCRGLYDQRGPKNASRWIGVAGERPTHRNTLAPYQDDDESGDSIGAVTESSQESEAQA